MASSEHLRIINTSHSRCENTTQFEFFPMLPTELRIMIWQYSVERNRFLEVLVEDTSYYEEACSEHEEYPPTFRDSPRSSDRGNLSTLGTREKYTVTIRGVHLHSRMLRVSREARNCTLQFYRVHLPCYLRKTPRRLGRSSTEGAVKSILYFNPEYDFMKIELQGPAESTFVNFLHDLKAYDPKHLGLLNMALGSNDMTNLYSIRNVADITKRRIVADCLSGVQEVVWTAHSMAGRKIIPYQGFHNVGFQFNHSMPVKPITPFFNILPRDPRPIGPDLAFVLTAWSDPRRMRLMWRELMERLNIRRAQPVRERVLFAYEIPTYGSPVYDVKTADQFLTREEEGWLSCQRGLYYPMVRMFTGKEPPVESPEQLLEAVRPAIGCWLFPAEALGDLDVDFGGTKRVFDMSAYWPELALSDIS